MKYLFSLLTAVQLVVSGFAFTAGNTRAGWWFILVGVFPLLAITLAAVKIESGYRLSFRRLAVIWLIVVAGVLVTFISAGAQTVLGGPRQLGGGQAGVPSPAPQAPVTAVPVPDSMVRQATDQAEGKFTSMKRGAVGGQIQEAWDSDHAKGTFKAQMCQDCEYKVRLRDYMVTVIELPSGEQIDAWDNGDAEAFEVKKRGDRRLAIRPQGFGIDTSLLVYGKSGATYPFYLRAEGVNSRNVPDLRFVIEGHVRVVKPAPLAEDQDPEPKDAAPGPADQSTQATKTDGKGASKALPPATIAEAAKAAGGVTSKPDDYVQTAPFNPDKLRGWGDYSLKGSRELRPETVFRDDYFTYIRFGDKWKDIELPTAYVVVDGIDENVNSRANGTTLVVESTQRLITLKSGQSFICIEYRGS